MIEVHVMYRQRRLLHVILNDIENITVSSNVLLSGHTN